MGSNLPLDLCFAQLGFRVHELITELIHQLSSTQFVDQSVADADVAWSAKELWAAQREQALWAVSGLLLTVALLLIKLLPRMGVVGVGSWRRQTFCWRGWSKIQSWWLFGSGWCRKRLGLVATDRGI